MLHHFECSPLVDYLETTTSSLVFDWDDETGDVTGRDAEFILAEFRSGCTSIHPRPATWDLTSTKNKTDLAAVIGDFWKLPPELADHYPQIEEDDWPEEDYIDEDGVAVIGRNSVVF
jgi:hypothetical protein